MADIKQAAQWLLDGKKVTRTDAGFEDGYLFTRMSGLLKWADKRGTDFGDEILSAEDLLADDWEIADE